MLVPIDAARPSRNSSSSSGVSRGGAAVANHVAGNESQTGFVRRIEQRAGPDARDDVDQRQLVIFHHEHHHAVVEHEARRLRHGEIGKPEYFSSDGFVTCAVAGAGTSMATRRRGRADDEPGARGTSRT